MTKPDPTTNTPHECVSQCVPQCVSWGSRAQPSSVRPPVPSSSIGDALNEPAAVRPPSASHTPTFHSGTTWLITHRTHPAWSAVLDLLNDGHWHQVETIAQAMRDTAGLAPRTIENHLRSATRRGWINRRRGRIRLRNRDAIEQALDHMAGAR